MTDRIESFLATLSDSERAELAMLRKHAFSRYTIQGEHVPHGDEKENLFALLTNKQAYAQIFMVENQLAWKAEAAKPENKNKAFVISRAVTDEQWKLKAVFFKGTKIENDNIFILEPHGPIIEIHRLDLFYRVLLDEEKLAAESRPIAERQSDPQYHSLREERFEGINLEKQVILQMLKVAKIGDLQPPKELSERRERLLTDIRHDAPYCIGVYEIAAKLARACYTLLLMEWRSMHKEFADPDDINVLNDTFILASALFLQATIMTKDESLRRMAGYANLKVFPARS